MSDEGRVRAVLEERLRSALRDTAESVAPDVSPGLEETIRRRGFAAARPARSRWRFIAPAVAATAVVAVALGAALLAPAPARHPGSDGTAPGIRPVPASADEPRYLITNPAGSPRSWSTMSRPGL